MLDPDILALVELGDDIGAIGLYQQRHGGSVLVARKAVEAARRQLGADEPAVAAQPATRMVDPQLAAAVRAGHKLPAIKRYMELHGVGLQEARDAVEAMQVPDAPAVPAAPPEPDFDRPGMQPELDRLIAADQKISAIKLYKDITGFGLKDCKDHVEARMASGVVTTAAAETLTPAGLQPELDRLILQGHKIVAIKHYRDLTFVGLKEAKDAVEARMAELSRSEANLHVAVETANGLELQPELDRLIAADQKIAAIKHYRTVTNVGLKEAKDAVEARMAELGR